ncbi:hypothetical protein OSB04_un001640 [Centaurea solstitialis]|uniref:F-box domain-containing protein n=1 Tax=Centaurea solstitialis TaxID=347529 RepID=A0AA38W2F8_9ASTR|nr:hypothetical protein OSB04_un001640 [Centaurea solstitialis]
MSKLVKRVRDWVSNGWIPIGSTSDQTVVCSSSAAGEVHRLPLDVFMLILHLLEPKDAARVSAVCKSWKLIVFKDALWMYYLKNNHPHGLSDLFAETKLRSRRYAVFIFAKQDLPLNDSEVIVIILVFIVNNLVLVSLVKAGVGYCKIGWSKYDSPSLRLATFVEFGDDEFPLDDRVHHFIETIFNSMHVNPSKQPVILTTPIGLHSGVEASEMELAVFGSLVSLRVPTACLVKQPTLALFASRRTSGILVNIGFRETQVVPIVNTYTRYGAITTKVGGLHLTRYLRRQLRVRNVEVPSLYTARTLKENLCYVALDYWAEFHKDTEASYKVGSEGLYTLKQERFRTGEVLFKPQLAGRNVKGLHQAVARCIDHCKYSTDRSWYKTIILAGGTAKLPGLAERLEMELRDLLPPSLSRGIRVIPSPYGADAAWHGAKMIVELLSKVLVLIWGSLMLVGGFQKSWCLSGKV